MYPIIGDGCVRQPSLQGPLRDWPFTVRLSFQEEQVFCPHAQGAWRERRVSEKKFLLFFFSFSSSISLFPPRLTPTLSSLLKDWDGRGQGCVQREAIKGGADRGHNHKIQLARLDGHHSHHLRASHFLSHSPPWSLSCPFGSLLSCLADPSTSSSSFFKNTEISLWSCSQSLPRLQWRTSPPTLKTSITTGTSFTVLLRASWFRRAIQRVTAPAASPFGATTSLMSFTETWGTIALTRSPWPTRVQAPTGPSSSSLLMPQYVSSLFFCRFLPFFCLSNSLLSSCSFDAPSAMVG